MKQKTEKIVINREGADRVISTTFEPNGVSHKLQKRVSEFLHERVKEYGICTTAELGYIGANTLTYCPDTGSVNLRIYFDPRVATRAKVVNAKKCIIPIKELTDIFSNYLFVGDVANVIGFDKINYNKLKVDTDELGRLAVEVKDSDKLEEVNVMYIDCSLYVAIAAILDIDLNDPNYKVNIETNKNGKKKDRNMIIATTASSRAYPVQISVSYTDNNDGYNPEDAHDYLVRLHERVKDAQKNAEKLQRKAHDKSKKKEAKQEKNLYKGFNKYT